MEKCKYDPIDRYPIRCDCSVHFEAVKLEQKCEAKRVKRKSKTDSLFIWLGRCSLVAGLIAVILKVSSW